jgi:hypothetical protein
MVGGTTLAQLNAAAVAAARAGDHAGAEAALSRLLDRARKAHLTHPDLHAAYSNRSAARLALGDAHGALADADAAAGLVSAAAAARGAPPDAHPSFPKACLRRGAALAALGRPADAAAALEAGLAADPASAALSAALTAARAAAAAGGGADTAGAARAQLEAAPAPLRIAYAPRGAPLALLEAPSAVSASSAAAAAAAAASAPGGLAARRRARVEGAGLPALLLGAGRAAEDRTLGEVYEYARVQVGGVGREGGGCWDRCVCAGRARGGPYHGALLAASIRWAPSPNHAAPWRAPSPAAAGQHRAAKALGAARAARRLPLGALAGRAHRGAPADRRRRAARAARARAGRGAGAAAADGAACGRGPRRLRRAVGGGAAGREVEGRSSKGRPVFASALIAPPPPLARLATPSLPSYSWPSLAGACRAVLAANGVAEGQDFSLALCRQYDELRPGAAPAAPGGPTASHARAAAGGTLPAAPGAAPRLGGGLGPFIGAPVHLVVADLVDDGGGAGWLLQGGRLTVHPLTLVASRACRPTAWSRSHAPLHARPLHNPPGVLTGGLLPSVAHALAHLLDPASPGPLVLPAGLEVLAQPVAVASDACRAAGARAFAAALGPAAGCGASGGGSAAGGDAQDVAGPGLPPLECRQSGAAGLATDTLDLSDLDPLRWCPSQALPAPLAPCALAPLASPVAVWAFDCLAPPEAPGAKEVDVAYDAAGAADAVVVWARVRLIGEITLTTGAGALLSAGGVAAGAGGVDTASSCPSWPPTSRHLLLTRSPRRL